MSAATVPLPTAVGPASTVSRPGSGITPPSSVVASPPNTGVSAAEALDQGGNLVGAQTSHTPRLGDPDLFHDLLRADLADTGEGLEENRPLQLADPLVGLPLADHLTERALRVLESILDLGSRAASLSRLHQGGGTLLGGQGGQSHCSHLSCRCRTR